MSGLSRKPRRFWLGVGAGVCLLSAPAAVISQSPRPRVPASRNDKGGSVLEIRHQVSMAEEKALVFTPRPVEPGQPSTRPAAPVSGRWFTNQYVNAAQNGRLPIVLSATSWRTLWNIPVNPGPVAVLRSQDRILVQGGGWRLLGADGKQVADGTGGRSAMYLDESHGLFYLINTTSYLEARSLTNGELIFQSPLLTNERFAWPLLVRFGKRMLMAGVEQAMASHVPRPGTESEVDLLEFAPKLEVDIYKQILSLTRGEILHLSKPRMVFAAQNDTLYAAAPDYLVIVGSGLDVHAVFQAQFTPLWISLDESGYMYLIVEVGGGKYLWVVTPEGKRIIQVALAREQQNIGLPPIVGYDHCIYLTTQNEVLAFTADGRPAWRHAVEGEIAGAAITPDHRLLVAAGSDLTIFDAQGQEIGRQHFEGQRLTSVPVLTEGGNLLVGTETHVYSLVPNGQPPPRLAP